jgi:serine/threonine protein kinase
MDAATGMLIGGRYRLEHQVGEGGMATVWVAEDEVLERWVAVKLLGASLLGSRSVRERFEREAVAIAKLRSPHIVQVFDYGSDGELAYIAMELLSGQDLYSWLKENRPVPLSKVATVVDQVARGLATAHRAGIVHRDLKPANIFVVRDHDEEVVKVFDFGLARGFSDGSQLRELEDRTGEGVLLGTPRYMSPEQAHGARQVDHRADLWSLGVIAYLAVTGRLPFDGTGVGEVVTKIATLTATPPSELVSNLDPAVDDFFARAFAKEPADRFQSAAELARAFREATGEGRTSSDLIPLDDAADTLVELTDADTEHASAPARPEPIPLPKERSRGPFFARAAMVLAAAAALTVGALGLARPSLQTAPAVPRVSAPDRAFVSPASANVPAPLAPPPVQEEPEHEPHHAPVVATEPAEPAPSASAPAEEIPAEAPSSTPASERGLELFDDRH